MTTKTFTIGEYRTRDGSKAVIRTDLAHTKCTWPLQGYVATGDRFDTEWAIDGRWAHEGEHRLDLIEPWAAFQNRCNTAAAVERCAAAASRAAGIKGLSDRELPPKVVKMTAKPIDDGGPAGAISIRDYFAAQVMTGALAHPNCTLLDTAEKQDDFAADCYQLADAMLKARGK